jgi:signal transduction histidine kinase
MSTSESPAVGEKQLRRLLDVGRALVAELDVDTILDQVLAVARELTGAHYAALGVVDEDGRLLERFITSGIDEELHRTIGALPRGRGVLGVLIDDPRPLRLTDVGSHPKSYGFPPGHPPMKTFLGVPIRIRKEVYGNLYMTEKDEGEFTEVDEEVISVLADWAAIAIDNARGYEGERRRRRELQAALDTLEATTDISRALGGETDHDRVIALIVKRARALVEARVLLIVLLDETGDGLVVSALAGEADESILGRTIPMRGSLSGDVLTSQRPMRLSEVSRRQHVALAEHLHPETGLFMPLVYRGRGLGVLCAYDRAGGGEFTADDERLLQGFAASASVAVATAQRFAEQGLRRSIEASERERTRWARELHDETLQDLAGLRVLLSGARRAGSDTEAALDDAVSQIEMSITGLRHLITELRPAALDAYGLGAAIEALVQRIAGVSGLDIAADVTLAWESGAAETRPEDEIESALYRLVQEALTNVTRHARAEHVHIVVKEDDHEFLVEVHDDGRGFDPTERREGFGLVGMRERVALVGGSLHIASGAGEGTVIAARVPARHRQR